MGLFKNTSQAIPDYQLVNIIVRDRGILERTIAYTIPDNDTYFVNAEKSNSSTYEQTIMLSLRGRNQLMPGDPQFTDYRFPVLVKINDSGNVIFARQYNAVKSNEVDGLYTYSFNSTASGSYQIFFTEKSVNFISSKTVITDTNGGIDCAQKETTVLAQNISWSHVTNRVKTNFLTKETLNILLQPLLIKSENFLLTKTVDCAINADCCKDLFDTALTKDIAFCEGSSYTLPDDRIIYTTGQYDVLLKTSKSCDSISIYNITVNKKPVDILSVSDTCLDKNNPITLTAALGYNSYSWLGSEVNTPVYNITRGGTYYVWVSNSCGSVKDSVNVYPSCDVTIMMPSAFTPNNDGINDLYRVPPQNKNTFESLEIYNRFGQSIFKSNDKTKGWNGMVNGISQQTGTTYIYHVMARDFRRKLVVQTGTFVLIR